MQRGLRAITANPTTPLQETLEPFGRSPLALAEELKSCWHKAPTSFAKIGDSPEKKESHYKYPEWGKNSSLTHSVLTIPRKMLLQKPLPQRRPQARITSYQIAKIPTAVAKSMRTWTAFVHLQDLWLGRGHPSLWEASLSVWKEITSPFEAADLTHKGFYF